MKTMTLDDVKKTKISESRLKEIKDFDEKFEDPECPPLTPDQLKQFKPWYEVHPEWYKAKKADVHLKIDIDVLEAIKAKGKGYQTRINRILRQAVMNGQI